MTAKYRKPWQSTLYRIRDRCTNKNSPTHRFYGAKGIKCRITSDELKSIWFRDKAHLLEVPSIDRIDNKKDYTFDNCRYIERRLNSSNGGPRTHCKRGHPMTGKNIIWKVRGHRQCRICSYAHRGIDKRRIKK